MLIMTKCITVRTVFTLLLVLSLFGLVPVIVKCILTFVILIMFLLSVYRRSMSLLLIFMELVELMIRVHYSLFGEWYAVDMPDMPTAIAFACDFVEYWFEKF